MIRPCGGVTITPSGVFFLYNLHPEYIAVLLLGLLYGFWFARGLPGKAIGIQTCRVLVFPSPSDGRTCYPRRWWVGGWRAGARVELRR